MVQEAGSLPSSSHNSVAATPIPANKGNVATDVEINTPNNGTNTAVKVTNPANDSPELPSPVAEPVQEASDSPEAIAKILDKADMEAPIAAELDSFLNEKLSESNIDSSESNIDSNPSSRSASPLPPEDTVVKILKENYRYHTNGVRLYYVTCQMADGKETDIELGFVKHDFPEVVQEFVKENKLEKKRIWKVPCDKLTAKGDRIIHIFDHSYLSEDSCVIRFDVLYDTGHRDKDCTEAELKKKAWDPRLWRDYIKSELIHYQSRPCMPLIWTKKHLVRISNTWILYHRNSYQEGT